MKIILSRKAFDTGNAPIPNPIMPDGKLCPLPIPYPRDRLTLGDIRFGKEKLADIVTKLSSKFNSKTVVHLDPDLRRNSRPRQRGWRPAFGQHHISQTHLTNQGVGPGDLFLFFGRFCQTTNDGALAFQRGERALHVLFGWLQVDRLVHPGDSRNIPKWLLPHPHVTNYRKYDANNTVYIASRRLAIPTLRRNLPGGGIFPKFADELRLTGTSGKTSIWCLPKWMYPKRGRPSLTYHNRAKWKLRKTHCVLQTVGKGQEFVLDCDHYPESYEWLATIFNCA